MRRSELERAWPATEPPPGFSERVLRRLQGDAASADPTPRRANDLTGLRRHRAGWPVLPAVALALAAALLLWPTGPARVGDVVSTEPRVVAIGERADAEMSIGAHLRWSGDETQQEVWQTRGAVTYRVQPGAAFRVHTPHGDVSVLGTTFRVVVAETKRPKGELMKKRWAVAGTGASLGALLWVGVDEGSVHLSNHGKEIVLGAGRAGAIGSDGIPRPVAALPSAPAEDARAADRATERSRRRRVADSVRRSAARRRAAALAPSQSAEPPAADQPAARPDEAVLREEHRFGPNPSGTAASPTEPDEARRREYVERTVREQYFPVARDCYEELLERQRTAAGKIVLEFSIVGNGDAGVVDRVVIREDEDTIDDPEFQLCMRESLYTAVFDPPPPGVEETTVVYPVMLAPE